MININYTDVLIIATQKVKKQVTNTKKSLSSGPLKLFRYSHSLGKDKSPFLYLLKYNKSLPPYLKYFLWPHLLQMTKPL